MHIEKLKEMSKNHVECACDEVQMYTLIHMAESIEKICSTLQAIEKKL